MGSNWGGGVKDIIYLRIGLGGFRLIVGSHLHFTKIDCFGGGWEMLKCGN